MTKKIAYLCITPIISGICGETDPALFDSGDAAWSHGRCTKCRKEKQNLYAKKQREQNRIRGVDMAELDKDLMQKSWLQTEARKMADGMYLEWRANH